MQFGASAGTLVVDPGAIFTGQVAANASVNDVLQLAGSTAATLTGLGSQFTGFADLAVGSGSTWTLAGPGTFGGTVQLSGILTVGAGVSITTAAPGAAAISLNASSAVLTNQGTLTGGAETGTVRGGQGALVSFGTLVNSGLIQGGAASTQGRGGVGVSLAAGAFLQNGGVIRGASGSYGGTGVNVYGTAVNTGTIVAGTGKSGTGNGVTLTGGTLTNAGTITAATLGEAVQFGKASGTLIIDPGAIFNGNIVANASFTDVLQLAGSTAGTLTGLGSQFTGFSSLIVNAGANWTLASGDTFAGPTTVSGTLTVGSGATLGPVGFGASPATLAINPGATFTGAVTATAGAHDTLQLGGTTAGTLTGFGSQFTNFATLALGTGAIWTIDSTVATANATVFKGQSAPDILELTGGGLLTKAENGFGTLQLDGSTTFQLKATSALNNGKVLVDAGAILQGTGVLSTSAVVNGEILTNTNAVLSLGGAVTGSGVLSSSSGGTLTLSGGFNFNGKLAGTGETVLASAGSFGTAIQIGSQVVVQEASVTLGGATTIASQLHAYDMVTTTAAQTITLSAPAGQVVTNDGTVVASGPGSSEILAALTNNGAISVESGTFSLLGAISNMSTISALGGTLFVADEVNGAGSLYVNSASTLSLQAGAASTETVNFLASTGLLDLANPATFAAEISGFAGSDKIDLINTAATKLIFSKGVLTVSNGSTTVASLHFSGSYTTQSFVLSSDHSGGSLITFHG